MRLQYRFLLCIFLSVGIMSFLSSCVKDEISNISPDKLKSKNISFGANVFMSDNITRSGSSSDKVDTRFLKNESDTSIILPLGVYSQRGIESIYNSQVTKGSVFTQDLLNSMKVWCTLTTSTELDNEQANKKILYINGDDFSKGNDDIFKSNNSYLWPGSGILTFDIFANIPESVTYEYNNTDVNTISDNYLKSFTYTSPVSVSEQKDIVYAHSVKAGNAEEIVSLSFEHIMSAVNFKVGDIAHGEIQSITLKGVYNTGKYNLSNGQWAIVNQNASHKSNYSVKFNSEGNTFTIGENTQKETFINDQTDGIFMMIPQIVPEGATIEVVFKAPGANSRTLTASIAGDDWGKDIITNYTISIDEQYNLNITPVGKLLDAHYIIAQVEVTVEGMNDASNVEFPDQWFLTSNINDVTMLTKKRIAAEESDATKHSNELQMAEAGFWCDKYVNRTTVNGEYVYTETSNSARGENQITGSGNVSKQLVYIFIPENNSTASREITLTLQKKNDSKVSKSVVLTQRCPGWIDDGSYGWETVDDDEDGQYGFTFSRKVAFEYVYSFGINRKNIIGSFPDPLTGTATVGEMDGVTMQRAQEIFTEDYIIPFAANKFAYYHYWLKTDYLLRRDYRFCMVLDYTKLNNIEDASSTTEGYNNTMALYALGGSATTSALETILLNVKKTESGATDQPTFGYHSTNGSCGGLDLTEGSETDLTGILSYILKKNKYYLYTDVDQLGGRFYAPIIKDEDINWYIPAYGQFATFKPNPNITDKNGGTDSPEDYWSSTAAENATNPADAKSYDGRGNAISRTTELGVIAVRNRDNDTKIINTSTTVDNSSLQGGNNGSTNNWVE